jgi:hypothetical protein
MKNRITRYFSPLRHPQIWNLALIPVLSVLLFIVLIYAILGYTSVPGLGEIYTNYYDTNDQGSMHLFFGFLLLMVLIVWLFKIFRNNAFNQFLPITQFYLVKEFFAILLVVTIAFFTIPTFHYFQFKSKQHISQSNQIKEDFYSLKMAINFIPIMKENYLENSYFNEMNVKVLKNDPELKAQYIKKFDELQRENVPYSLLFSGPYRDDTYYIENDDNNIKNDYFLTLQKTKIRWLLNHNVDSIELCINRFKKTLDKYHVPHNLDAKSLAANVFIDNQFSPKIMTAIHDNGDFPNYVDPYIIESRINYYYSFDEDRFSKDFNLPFIFGFALLLAMIVFSARVINRRTWGFSWLAFAITTIAFGLFMALAAISSRNLRPEFISFCFLILHFGILFFAIYNIQLGDNKFKSGIALNMVLFSLPFVVTHCLVIYYSGNEPFASIDKIKFDTTLAYTLIYMLLFVVLVYIPLVYRWKGLKNNT